MKPTETFDRRLEEMYGPERKTAIIDQMEQAQMSVGTETLIGQLSDQSREEGLYLEIQEVGYPKQCVRLEIGEHLIGRSPDCKIGLHHVFVSRIHCLITVHADGHITLRDMHSRNGIIVNGVQVDPLNSYPIQEGDVILASGSCRMMVVHTL